MLLLNPAARQQAEQNRFDLPATFLQPPQPEVPTRVSEALRDVPMQRRTIRMFARTITVDAPLVPELDRALTPWTVSAEDGPVQGGQPDLRIEATQGGYVGCTRSGLRESFSHWRALAIWFSREFTSLVHERTEWFATLHAGGVLYQGKLFAFPGLSHSGKSTLIATLCAAGCPYFAEDCLPVLDNNLQTAAVPLPIKLRKPGWPVLRDHIPGFDNLPLRSDGEIPVRYWQPPPHDVKSAPIEALVFPRFAHNAEPEWSRLPLVETLFEFIASQSAPVENSPASWQKLVNTLTRIPAFAIRYGSVEDSHRLLQAVANECK